MRIIYDAISIFIFAARRLWHNLPLMLGTALGLVTAVALVVSVPVYADGVNSRLLSRVLFQQQSSSTRPPYAFMFRYVGGWFGLIDWPAFEKADTFFQNEAPGIVGLPLTTAVRYVGSDVLRLFPPDPSGKLDSQDQLEYVSVGTMTGLADHIKILDGRLPRAQSAQDTEPLEVIIYDALSSHLGIVTGEDLVVVGNQNRAGDYDMNQIPVRVVGVWREHSVDDPYWYHAPDTFENTFLTSQESFQSKVVPAGKKPVYSVAWYMIFDGSRLYTEQVPSFLGRINYLATSADQTLAHTNLSISPMDALWKYVESTRLLTVIMYVFAIPIIGLVLYFVMLTTNLVVRRQRNEIAVLRSRGTSVLQIVLIYLVEGAILGAAALAIGPIIGTAIARAMGATESFLSFGAATEMSVRLSQQSMRLAVGAVIIALLGSMLPAFAAARHTIVTYKQDIARSLEAPWWQRLYLDILLLAIPLYGYYLLRQRGTIPSWDRRSLPPKVIHSRTQCSSWCRRCLCSPLRSCSFVYSLA